jgi:hypothetical protein
MVHKPVPRSEEKTGKAKVDRRASVRHATSRDATCNPISARAATLPVLIRDVSTGGIGLLATRRFERGTLLVIEVADEEQTTPSPMVGRVAHVTHLDDGDWLIGCQFVGPLSDDDVKAVLRQLPPEADPFVVAEGTGSSQGASE